MNYDLVFELSTYDCSLCLQQIKQPLCLHLLHLMMQISMIRCELARLFRNCITMRVTQSYCTVAVIFLLPVWRKCLY